MLNQLPQLVADVATITTLVGELKTGEIEELHTSLDALCYEAIQQGFITEEQFTRLNQVYNVYHSLGGNGSGTKLYQQASQLPIKNTDEKA
ncbi:hypothetical protein PT285_11015 [Lactobacillus sp. ESL0791]|uniref:hypothetical protein n=1 Tax=Lactobacillus sp. ESL0791 TaxID=2983234 RepID=UPI0023F83A6C|nr:hypothetical protein [Lactobacillus sp. ESL0791]MDF7639931.1 hypothetical protein [Lactobacillus sp. ESL0791]